MPRHPESAHEATGPLPDEAFAAALLALPALWPARLAALLGMPRGRQPELFEAAGGAGATRTAEQGWALVRSGRAAQLPELVRLLGHRGEAPEVLAGWRQRASRLDVARLWAGYRRLGVQVSLLGGPGYPARLAGDRAAPPVLFRCGAAPDLDRPSVAIVGTRRCSTLGTQVALEFGMALTEAGVRVVSGLALGIDAAAHLGALKARAPSPVGVIAGGVDIPYPARHRRLWSDVARTGVLVSEWPLGTRSEGWRFPARNRIIAAIADVVVVVESRGSGGSMITADEALRRDVPLLAVPGSIRNPAAEGTNRLLRDGAAPACDVADVMVALSLARPEPARSSSQPAAPPSGCAATAGVSGAAAVVLEAVGWEPTPLEVVLRTCALSRDSVTLQLANLELDGWVASGSGGWQRVGGDGS